MQTFTWDVRKYVNNLQSYPQIQEIIDGFHQDELIALPTETVYGLGANARSDEAVKNIYVAKGRPSDNPLIIHIHDKAQLEDFTQNISPETEVLMDVFWPGPISFIVPYQTGYLTDRVTGGLNSVAVRMPSHSIGREVLKLVDLPIAAPSANLSGRPSPTKFEHVKHDLDQRIFGIIQAEDIDEGIESTVIDCTTYPFKIARPGSITADMINEVLPGSIIDLKIDMEKPIAPGMKYKHYAPSQPVVLIEGGLTKPIQVTHADHHRIAVIGPKSIEVFIPEDMKFIPLGKDENDIKGAHHDLYDALRIADQFTDIDQIYINGYVRNASTMALMNRIDKASGHNIKGEDAL